MKTISTTTLANWLSRIIRWALAAALFTLAITYDHEPALYVAAALAFVSGFFKPKRCTAASCSK